MLNTHTEYFSDFQLRTLTCNRLSHCLFDFDCPDFNVYEQEQYNYQEFNFRTSASQKVGMIHSQNAPLHLTSYDTIVTRDVLKVHCRQFEQVPQRRAICKDADKLVIRFLYKHRDGVLWVFNRSYIESQWFKEIPHPLSAGVVLNRIDNSQEARDREEDEENDVDLERSMWLIIRKKQSINKVLKDFCPEYQAHKLRVRDIIKFGRVNFKITALQCDKISKEYQGSCYAHLQRKTKTTARGGLQPMYTTEDSQEDQSMSDFTVNQTSNINLTEMHLQGDQSQFSLQNQDDTGPEGQVERDQTVLTVAASQLSIKKQPVDDSTGGNHPVPLMAKKTTLLNQSQSQQADNFLQIEDQLNPHDQTDSPEQNTTPAIQAGSNRSNQNVCRICLCEEEEGNPLIMPCKCAGSMGQIHQMCLKEWLHAKRHVYDGVKVVSYFWRALECELCKEPFERKMRSSMFNIMEFDLPNAQGKYEMGRGRNYMILESINSMPAKVVHVFDLRHDSFKVGRSVETDMKIADISVSRTHSYFKVRDHRLYVEDNGSKFGTLIKIQRPLDVLRSKMDGSCQSTLLQVGRTLLYLNFATKSKMKFACASRRQIQQQREAKDLSLPNSKQNNDGSYLRLLKDHMRIPSEFFDANVQDEDLQMEFPGARRLDTGESIGKQSKASISQHGNGMMDGGNSLASLQSQGIVKSGTLIPPLKIPKNPAHELNTRLAIERYESRESVQSSSSEVSLSSSHQSAHQQQQPQQNSQQQIPVQDQQQVQNQEVPKTQNDNGNAGAKTNQIVKEEQKVQSDQNASNGNDAEEVRVSQEIYVSEYDEEEQSEEEEYDEEEESVKSQSNRNKNRDLDPQNQVSLKPSMAEVGHEDEDHSDHLEEQQAKEPSSKPYQIPNLNLKDNQNQSSKDNQELHVEDILHLQHSKDTTGMPYSASGEEKYQLDQSVEQQPSTHYGNSTIKDNNVILTNGQLIRTGNDTIDYSGVEQNQQNKTRTNANEAYQSNGTQKQHISQRQNIAGLPSNETNKKSKIDLQIINQGDDFFKLIDSEQNEQRPISDGTNTNNLLDIELPIAEQSQATEGMSISLKQQNADNNNQNEAQDIAYDDCLEIKDQNYVQEQQNDHQSN